MDSVKIWNRIVKHYKDYYSAKEEVLQKDWEQIFSDLLNYSRFFGEIDSHRSIHIGSHQRTIPDIIIRGDDGDLFDVELKQYNMPFSIEFENQLKSYLDLLHISVGVLVCQKIYLYVYDFSKSKLKKMAISFTENNPDGVKFVELMKKGSFSADKVENFIDSKVAFKENVQKIKETISKEFIKQLIVDYFIKNYSEEEIMTALGDRDYSEEIIHDGNDEPGNSGTDNTDNNDPDDSSVYAEPSFNYVMIKTSHERIQKCNGSLYEATRYAWRAGERITQYNYVISVIGGVVQEVYVADKWNIVQSGELVGRYEFHGRTATNAEARALIGKTIPFKYRKPGSANPVMFKKP
ncbi:MAG: hypothetical protein IJX92_03650 [Clostridia bacterium]|nr:hypothetical protein [Clostridia bacterium]